MYLDASFPGFDNEHLIGHFLGFQADKIYLNGLTANIRELMSKINLQEGENKLGKEAGKQLEWSCSTFPPIYFVYTTSPRVHPKAEYASKAIGIGVIAEERLALVRTLLARVTKEKVLPGLGRYYNTVPYNRQFYWVIKWQNDTINKTAILRIVGITQQVMLAPIKASRQANTTASPITTKLCTEINNSGNFSSSNSTKSAADAEDRWPLIVADAAKVKEASKYVLQITKYIYSATNSQIPLGTRILVNPIQDIEGKAQTMVRARNPISGQQASAWGPVFANNNTTKGGSRMQNLPSRKMRQVRKKVKLSLDPESTSEFPDLQTTDKPDKDTMKSITSKAKSNTSSHSTVSGVTKADFLTLGKELLSTCSCHEQSTECQHRQHQPHHDHSHERRDGG